MADTIVIAHRVSSRIRAYVLLTKPRVIELLLVTTVPAMVLAEGGLPSLTLIGAVLLGGALAAGGANTINCWIERDRDRVMHRTRRRPLPAGQIEPGHALVFGIALEAVAFLWLWGTVNLLAASLAVSAMLFYVFVYTIWLKPRSTQNIVIGGAAGAVPVLVGWAAVTGTLDAPAWVLFAIVFCWTPPHFWALSLRYRDDYEAAGIPMLPVARGIAERGAADPRVLAHRRGGHAAAVPFRVDGRGVPRRCRRARWRVHLAGVRPPARRHPETRHATVHVLEHLPRAALRGHCRRHARPSLLTGRGRGCGAAGSSSLPAS